MNTKTRGRSRVLPGLVDQAFSSGSNVLLVLAVARVSAPESFGIFALGYVGVTVALAVVRGSLGTPISLLSATSEGVRVETFWAVRRVAIITTPLLVAGILLAAFSSPSMRSIGMLLAALPVVLIQDLLRFACLALDRSWTAALADGFWALASGTLLASTWALGPWADAHWFVAIWLMSGVVSLVVLCVAALGSPTGWQRGANKDLAPKHQEAPTSGDRVRLGLDASMGAWVTLIVTSGVTVVLDPVAAAALRGAGAVLGPVNVLLASLQSVFVPLMVRRPRGTMPELLAVAAPVTSCVAAFAISVSLMGALLPDRFGEMLLGPTWIAAAPVLIVLGIEFLGHAILGPLLTVLRAKNRSRVLIRVRIGMGAAQIVFSLAAAYLVGSAVAVALASVLVAWGATPFVWTAVRRETLRDHVGLSRGATA